MSRILMTASFAGQGVSVQSKVVNLQFVRYV
ncbi:unknown [Odoribacter sp. CAG:788]|jgi:hypothetical protein|nr:unknown [Odoribacter sp. CAG:788]